MHSSQLVRPKIQIIRQAKNCAGFYSRRRLPGPECELVDRFVEKFRPSILEGCRVSIFFEPGIGNCFPDLVVVNWKQTVADSWPKERTQLQACDLKLMQFLYSGGPVSAESLQLTHGRQGSQGLERLLAAKMVSFSKNFVRIRPLREIFAVRRVVAYEAKIFATEQVLAQALMNTWFANCSNILLPQITPRSEMIRAATQAGIGIWVEGRSKPLVAPVPSNFPQPACYASWLLNDWCWRLAQD